MSNKKTNNYSNRINNMDNNKFIFKTETGLSKSMDNTETINSENNIITKSYSFGSSYYKYTLNFY